MDRERVLDHQTVLVRDGRITALGSTKAVAVPAEAVRIDARGKYLLPGLADMHVHLVPKPVAVPRIPAIDAPSQLLGLLATGVTTVRNMWGHYPGTLELRDSVARGALQPRPKNC